MAEYIERETAYALSKKICDAIRNREYHPATFGHLILDWIDDLPAADVREVVRCADCKWFQCNMRQDGYLPKGVSEYECRYWCGAVDPIDFCSHWADMREETE